MKKWITILPVFIIMAVLLSVSASAEEYDPSVDYTAKMLDAAVAGDYVAGLEAETARNAKIDLLGLDYEEFTFEDMMLLAKIIYAEAGCEWLSDDWKMCVGEVVMNRVASPEFADTIRDVLESPGQYYGKNSSYFNSLLPSYRCAQAAVRLLNGERLMTPDVVFQANFRQGSGVAVSYYDSALGHTYFCYSSHKELYEVEAA